MSENLKFRILEKYETGGGAKLPIDYEDPKQVIHRPSINDVELVGNKKGEELGLADASQIAFITERIDGHDAQIGDMQTQIDDIETDVEKISTLETDVEQLKTDVSNHSDAIASLDETVAEHTTAIENLELAKADKTYVDGLVDAETTNRENADNQLQEQIDAIVSSSDVKDIVGTYAELQSYDTSSLGDEDIIKVLNDSTHENAMSYYRWNATTQQWSYVGSEGPYYTKSESDNRYVPVTRTVNGKALSTNIELNATDVGAQDILVSGENIKTVNHQSLLGAGNIDISDVFVANYGTTNFADIETAITNGKVVVVKGFNQHNQGEVYVVSVFTKLYNGTIYLTCVESGMSNVIFFGTNTNWQFMRRELQERLADGLNIKTINNESLLGSGNIDIQGGAELTIDSVTDSATISMGNNYVGISEQNGVPNISLTQPGEYAKSMDLQSKLISGTNIKTINNESLLGSGNIDIQSGGSSVFFALYGTTTYQEVLDAINAFKAIFIMININGQPTLLQATSYSVFNEYVQFGMYSVNGEWGVLCIYSDNTWDYDQQFTSLATVDQLPTIDTTISDTSTNPVQNKVIKSYIDNREPAIEVQGNWHYRIYNDGTFEAWYGASGVTFVITEQSGNLYRSGLQTLTLPTNLTDQGTIEIISFDVGVGHNNYPVFSSIANMSDTDIKYYVMSGSSRNSSPNYKLSAYVYGLISKN